MSSFLSLSREASIVFSPPPPPRWFFLFFPVFFLESFLFLSPDCVVRSNFRRSSFSHQSLRFSPLYFRCFRPVLSVFPHCFVSPFLACGQGLSPHRSTHFRSPQPLLCSFRFDFRRLSFTHLPLRLSSSLFPLISLYALCFSSCFVFPFLACGEDCLPIDLHAFTLPGLFFFLFRSPFTVVISTASDRISQI